MYKIPFNKPFIVGKELYYMAQSVLSGHISGDGFYSKECEHLLEERLGAHRVLLTTSCTTALEMSALLCDLEEGDEVILPSYSFVSTANAFHLRGARLRFVDIRRDTLNLDERLIEDAITERTKVIVPVHYAGVACEMDSICEIAKRHGLFVVEDAAQGVAAKHKGSYLGTIGDLATFSFHETKNFICGEGGALVLNDDRFVERAEIIREKGTNRSQFFRGEIDKYTWVDVGSSCVLSDLLAAFLYAQLEHIEEIVSKRRSLYETYYEALQPLAARGLLTLPTVPDACESNYHMFYVVVNDAGTRTALIEHLKQKSILAVFHYVPLHTSAVGQKMKYEPGMLPVTESISERLLRLPFYYELSEDDVRYVVREISSFYSVDA